MSLKYMDTLRVNLCYRPLRIAWAIKSGDIKAFRKAVRYSHALWGGRFNPIIFTDREDSADKLIELFRVDVIIPINDDEECKTFLKKYAHLIRPFFHESVFMKGDRYSEPYSNILDIHNLLAYMQSKQRLNEIYEYDLHYHFWESDDPLADVFLSQLGDYPRNDEIDRDYLKLLKNYSRLTEVALEREKAIPVSAVEFPNISSLSCYGLEQHYGIRHNWNFPGFYIGSVNNLDDLVHHWNLRACNIPLWFIDLRYPERYANILPILKSKVQTHISANRHKEDRNIAIWTQAEELQNVSKLIGEQQNVLFCKISDVTWNGKNVSAPMMHFGETSVLGVMGIEQSRPKISFALSDKPFCGDSFHKQHLVASVSFIGGLYGDEQHTLNPPYLPELNEFYGREMHFRYNKLRIESERIGIVIDAAEHDSFLFALSVSKLMEQIFNMAGYQTQLSNAGLITKQLITRLNGVQGGRVFKVPGVRRLLKTHGPNSSLSKRAALQAIGSRDPNRPDAKFTDHKNLYIEPRPRGEELTTDIVFGYLVEKGLFRVGVDLSCPSCNMNSWIPLDSLKHKVVCDLCGHEHDVTRKLTNLNEWHYRRSGILGVERNLQGAVPVLLTLQQLDTNFQGLLNQNMYSPSLNLTPKSSEGGVSCETDFVWIVSRAYPDKTVVILAECKDQGPISVDDVNNLKEIADSLPNNRFETFIVFSQISPFTEDEIKLVQQLNDGYRQRVILLSANELEPYYIGERTKDKAGRELHWFSPSEMAKSTAQLYFNTVEE